MIPHSQRSCDSDPRSVPQAYHAYSRTLREHTLLFISSFLSNLRYGVTTYVISRCPNPARVKLSKFSLATALASKSPSIPATKHSPLSTCLKFWLSPLLSPSSPMLSSSTSSIEHRLFYHRCRQCYLRHRCSQHRHSPPATGVPVPIFVITTYASASQTHASSLSSMAAALLNPCKVIEVGTRAGLGTAHFQTV